MSLLWGLLGRGVSVPRKDTWGQRLMLWCGRRLALLNRYVTVPASCCIHPEASIHPRSGAIRFGERCIVAANAVVQGNVELGDDCSIQTGSMLVGYGSREEPSGRIRIGNMVRIAPMVMMISANHVFDDPDRPICKQGLDAKPITIEDDVWIAGRVNIMAGVTIGRGSVIGAGAVVTHDIPPMSIAVGVPAKIIARRGDVAATS